MTKLVLTLSCLILPVAFAFPRGLSPLKVQAERIVNERGEAVRLRGVNTACLEWSTDGEGHLQKTLDVAIKDWKADIIRLPLSQDRWFGKADEQKDQGKAYRALVKQAVQYCAANQCYILLDLHWNGAGMWGKNIGQHEMADMNSVLFWKDCAREYRNNPAVIFDLYNEPHDISWDLWLNGGMVDEQVRKGARQGTFLPTKYETPGMQKLLDTVRAVGARNLVVAGGLDWAYDLSGMLNGFALKDPKGRGVVYACHAYPNKGETVDQFLVKLDKALPRIPVIISEFGAQSRGEAASVPNPWLASVMKAIEERRCSWIAWDLHPSAGPCLISGWDYKPTASFGAVVKAALATR